MKESQHPARILVVDDEPMVARAIAAMAQSFGHEVVVAESAEAALERFAESPFDVVLTDLRMGRQGGIELLREIQQRAAEVPVVLITGQATVDSAMQAIQAGAYDYLTKPIRPDAIGKLLERAVLERRRRAEAIAGPPRESPAESRLEPVAGRSPQMLEVFKTVARVAPGKTNVLILGESGTGKELVARALHRLSLRAEQRFVPVNVSAIPEGLLESELFGHVRGAFTGATANRRGLFEEAHQGTLFLDEIGDLSMPLQAKLLRVIQEHCLKPVGGNEEIGVDVRLVAATHRNLEELVRAGRFREDLYYRLNVVAISLPPLRERRDDIPILVDHFLRRFEQSSGRPAPRFSAEALQQLVDYTWPGNVRELENVVESAALLSNQRVITPDSLPSSLRLNPEGLLRAIGNSATLEEMIFRYVETVLIHTQGNRTRAAKILGISRRTLHRMAARRRGNANSDSDNVSHDGTN